MENIKLKISPPWVTYINELMALFREDPEINIKYDNNARRVKLFVNNEEKAQALYAILPYFKCFGNTELDIQVVPPNADRCYIGLYRGAKEVYEIAFKRNPVLSFVHEVNGIFSNTITYVVFKNKVVQFFNDNLNDVYGNISTLYQEIAKDVFNENSFCGVCYCTDVDQKLKKPLGEWP